MSAGLSSLEVQLEQPYSENTALLDLLRKLPLKKLEIGIGCPREEFTDASLQALQVAYFSV